MKIRKTIVLALTVAGMFGCSLYDRVKPGFHRDYSRHFSFDVRSDGWMANPFSDGFLMSRDGYAINYIFVSREKLNADLGPTKQVFLEGMDPLELSDVEKDRIRSNSAVTNFQIISDAPVKIDGRRGFRFEYAYTTYQGLDVRGIRCGFIQDRWMYEIVYEGLSGHYFEKNLPEFESFLSSFKVL